MTTNKHAEQKQQQKWQALRNRYVAKIKIYTAYKSASMLL